MEWNRIESNNAVGINKPKHFNFYRCVLYIITLSRHHGLRHLMCHRLHIHRRKYLLLRILSPFWWCNPRIRCEVVAGQSAKVCHDNTRETGHLFHGSFPWFHSLDDTAGMLP